MLYSAPDDSLFGECLNHKGCLDYLESNERATFYQLFEAYPDLVLYDNGQYMTALYGINNFSGCLFMQYEFHGADMNRIRNHVNRKNKAHVHEYTWWQVHAFASLVSVKGDIIDQKINFLLPPAI